MNRTIAALVEELHDAPAERAAAIRAELAALGPDGYHALLGALGDHEAIRAAAFSLLATDDPPALSPGHLREFVRRAQASWRVYEQPSRAEIVHDAMLALGEPLHAMVPGLLRDIRDPDPLVHGAAARDLETLTHFLGPVGPEDGAAGAALREALGDACSDVRVAAAGALGNLLEDPALCVPALAALLGDPSRRVRGAAAEALGAFGPEAEEAVGPLAALLADAHLATAVRAAAAVVAIGSSTAEVHAGLLALARRPEAEARYHGLASLGALPSPSREGVEALTAASKGDPDPVVREVAARALTAIVQRHGNV